MKIMLFDKTYNCRILSEGQCHICVLKDLDCSNIPVMICLKYGGFQPSDTKIFTL